MSVSVGPVITEAWWGGTKGTCLVIFSPVELAVLAFTRKVVTAMLFDQGIVWCGEHLATFLNPNKCILVCFSSLSSPTV